MDKQYQELVPEQLLVYAKKHSHSVNVSTQAFTLNGRDFVVHNISLKGDPNGNFDIINYRRGLTFIEEIINFKEQKLRVGKKGLRKFFDLMPEFLGEKVSHISNSRHFNRIKDRIFSPLNTQASSFIMYSTEKANGQNVQISWDEDGQFWVIGSKNKTLLLSELKDTKYLTHKFEHVRTISIAEEWFKFLESNAEKVEEIKNHLSKFVLIGQICDSAKSGHIVDYGSEAKLYFYALVAKQEREVSCEAPSKFLQFAKSVGLQKHCVRYQITEVKTFEALMQQLKKQMYKVYQGELSKFGEGTVVYITIKQNNQQKCQSIINVKSLQYRIYRKLRQKLKAYFEKYRKTYEKMLNKYIEEVKELTKGFVTPKPEQYYFNIGRRAFQFCQHQQKAITKYFHNHYVQFLKLLQNQKIDKETFKKIVHQEIGDVELEKIMEEKQPQLKTEKKQEQDQTKQKQTKNNLLIFIPLTIPATGKSTLFRKLKQNLKEYYVQILSSDTTRLAKMEQLMKKQKNLSKQAAFDKTRESANKEYYTELNNIMKRMEANKQYENCILFMDKNHPESALKKTIEQIQRATGKCKNLNVKIGCILPKCQKFISAKGKYQYPFSTCYIASCIKRVLDRQKHETLQGTQNHKVSVGMNFANMFRNFKVSDYNLSKHFNTAIMLPFTKQQQVPQQISDTIIHILLTSKPNSFDEHPSIQQLIEQVKKWKYEEVDGNEQFGQIRKTLAECFDNFEGCKVDVNKLMGKSEKKEE